MFVFSIVQLNNVIYYVGYEEEISLSKGLGISEACLQVRLAGEFALLH